MLVEFKKEPWDSRGPGSVAGIATAYGLDGPGIESLDVLWACQVPERMEDPSRATGLRWQKQKQLIQPRRKRDKEMAQQDTE